MRDVIMPMLLVWSAMLWMLFNLNKRLRKIEAAIERMNNSG